MTKKFFIAGIFLVFAFFLPYFILWDNSFVIDGDNLDSNVVWFKIIAESGKLFASNLTPIEGIMGHLPRLSFPTEMNLITLFYYFFEPWVAYIFNLIIMRLVAFTSMFLLLRKLTRNRKVLHLSLITSFSLLFALLPFWPSAGLSVAAQPLVIYLFLMIRKGKHNIWPYLILFLYPFYSSLVLSGLFVGFALSVWFVVDIINTKKVNYRFLLGLLLLIVGYIISSYRLFLYLWGGKKFGFISHRSEMKAVFHDDFFGTIKEYLFQGQFHAALIPVTFGLLILLCLPFLIFKKRYFSQQVQVFVLSSLAAVFLAAVLRWEEISFLYEHITFMQKFQFDRFYFLIPVLATVSAYLILRDLLGKKRKIGISASILLVGISLLLTVRNDKNYSVLVGKYLLGREIRDPSFSGFYAESMFNEIDTYIEEGAKIINFGIHPAVAQYNDLVTLDGYMANYPLKKKHHFLKMLGPQFNKNEKSLAYIEDWGSRLYIFDDQYFEDRIRFKWSTKIKEVASLEVDWKAVERSGGDYFLSTNPVRNNKLTFIKRFQDAESAWVLYLYRI